MDPASGGMDGRSRPIARRVVLKGLGGAMAAWPARGIAASDPLRFGLTPVFLDSDVELLRRLRAYLAGALGRPVTLVKRRTYQEIAALLVSGQIDAAWICGYPFVTYRHQLHLVATPLYRGEPLYQSYLVVQASHAAEDWRGLRGTVHAYSDPDSNSGYLVTRHLLAGNGESPDGFFRKSFFTYGHRNVIRAVASGLAGSGSVDGYVWDVIQAIDPALAGATRVVRRSEQLGFPPIACHRALAGSALEHSLRGALLGMAEDPRGRLVLEMLHLDGFVAGSPHLFDGIARMVTEMRDRA